MVVSSIFSSLFPKAKVSVLAGLVGVRADSIP